MDSIPNLSERKITVDEAADLLLRTPETPQTEAEKRTAYEIGITHDQFFAALQKGVEIPRVTKPGEITVHTFEGDKNVRNFNNLVLLNLYSQHGINMYNVFMQMEYRMYGDMELDANWQSWTPEEAERAAQNFLEQNQIRQRDKERLQRELQERAICRRISQEIFEGRYLPGNEELKHLSLGGIPKIWQGYLLMRERQERDISGNTEYSDLERQMARYKFHKPDTDMETVEKSIPELRESYSGSVEMAAGMHGLGNVELLNKTEQQISRTLGLRKQELGTIESKRLFAMINKAIEEVKMLNMLIAKEMMEKHGATFMELWT